MKYQCPQCNRWLSKPSRLCFTCKKIIQGFGNFKIARTCIKCSTTKPIGDNNFPIHSQSKFYSICRPCLSKMQSVRYNYRKNHLNKLGFCKCMHCGYDKYIGSIEYHHIDKNSKDFSNSRYWSLSPEKRFKELLKCIPLCANCHREYHGNMIDNQLILQYHKEFQIKVQQELIILEQKTKLKLKKVTHNQIKKQHIQISKIPQKTVLEKLIWTIPSRDIAKKFNVSDTTIGKWCKKYNLKKPCRGYWMKINSKKTKMGPLGYDPRSSD